MEGGWRGALGCYYIDASGDEVIPSVYTVHVYKLYLSVSWVGALFICPTYGP